MRYTPEEVTENHELPLKNKDPTLKEIRDDNEKIRKLKFNRFDKPKECSRIAHKIIYEIDANGYPLNPYGRTQLKGRGDLPRWGPNHAEILLISR